MAAAAAIFSFTIFALGHGSRLFKRTGVLKAHFHRINGLQAGAPVTLSGVKIGAVDSISFPANPRADYVVVRMWIQNSALSRVHADSLARITTMGLLGDKFVELTPGSPAAPPVRPAAVLEARDPIDYEALLQNRGTGDLIMNVMTIAQSVRSLLDQIETGHGLLSVLLKGGPTRPGEPQLTLADVHKAFGSLERLSSDMSRMIGKINRGEGLAGAMLSDRTNGRRLLAGVERAMASMIDTSRKLNALADRFNRAQGTVPRLLEDKQYADELLANLRESSGNLRGILRKINSGQGTVGLAVNDPALYNEAKGFLGESGSVGWGIHLLNGVYSLTHPFSAGFSETPAPVQPVTATAPDAAGAGTGPGIPAAQPASGTAISPAR